jgi:hypothetical protein
MASGDRPVTLLYPDRATGYLVTPGCLPRTCHRQTEIEPATDAKQERRSSFTNQGLYNETSTKNLLILRQFTKSNVIGESIPAMSYNTEYTETIEVLKVVPGGMELLAWFGGEPTFGDGEILELSLNFCGPSRLRVVAFRSAGHGTDSENWPRAIVTFDLADMIDVSIEGFAQPNINGGLQLRWAREKNYHPSLLGIGMSTADHEIELEPCAGAFGTIRASIIGVSFECLRAGETHSL